MAKAFGRFAAIAAAITCMAAPAAAAPLDPALQAQLLQIYDGYNRAVTAGKIDDAIALRSSEAGKEVRGHLGPAERAQTLVFLNMTVPDAFEVLHTHIAKDGASANILILAHKKVPPNAPPGGPPAGTVSNGEVTLDFVNENGAWRFDAPVFGMDPSHITPCRNQAFEPIEAYDQDRNTSMGGPIVRVDYEASYTLLIVRVTDEENCVYLPNRDALKKSGLNTDLLIPYAIAEIEGFPHKSDKQKVWGAHVTVDDDD
jgi:hypothetical protein